MRKPRQGYEEQNHINLHCVKMARVAMIHFGLDPGKFLCFLAGKYTGHYQDVCCTLNVVQDHITPEDHEHMKQILLDGCPARPRQFQEFCQKLTSGSKNHELRRLMQPFSSNGSTSLQIFSISLSYYPKYHHKRRKK
jgi:hypothetical protein